MAHDYAPHDFNHDLYSDILWRNSQGDVAVWSIRDNALVTGLFLERAPANEHIVSSGDLNGDLTSDIVWRNTDTGNIHYWLVNNTAITFRGDIYNPGTEWTAIDRGAAQFNTDAYQDILFQHAGGQLHIWDLTPDGRGGVTIGSSGNVGDNPGPAWHPRRVGDYNGDGHNDVFWQHDNGSLAVWSLNDRQKLEGYSRLPNPQAGTRPPRATSTPTASPTSSGTTTTARTKSGFSTSRQTTTPRSVTATRGRNGCPSAPVTTMPMIMPTSCGATPRTAASPSGTCKARSSLAPSFSAP